MCVVLKITSIREIRAKHIVLAKSVNYAKCFVYAQGRVAGMDNWPGLPDFSLYNTYTKTGKTYHNVHKMAIKYTKLQSNRGSIHKIYTHLSLQDTVEFAQIGIFGLKYLYTIWHTAVGAVRIPLAPGRKKPVR
jgi:hypothetical protein